MYYLFSLRPYCSKAIFLLLVCWNSDIVKVWFPDYTAPNQFILLTGRCNPVHYHLPPLPAPSCVYLCWLCCDCSCLVSQHWFFYLYEGSHLKNFLARSLKSSDSLQCLCGVRAEETAAMFGWAEGLTSPFSSYGIYLKSQSICAYSFCKSGKQINAKAQ